MLLDFHCTVVTSLVTNIGTTYSSDTNVLHHQHVETNLLIVKHKKLIGLISNDTLTTPLKYSLTWPDRFFSHGAYQLELINKLVFHPKVEPFNHETYISFSNSKPCMYGKYHE